MKGPIGSFYFRKARTIRQKYSTGSMFYRRKEFHFPRRYHRMYHRLNPNPAMIGAGPMVPEHKWYAHLPGDVSKKPEFDFSLAHREDKAMYAWRKNGRLQVYQMGGKSEVFVCYHCGYPVKSHLVAIKDDNWDWRMCYQCYTQIVRDGMQNVT